MSYGRIVRDEAGNVIDIILEEDEPTQEEQEDGGRGALNPEKEWEPEAVEAKTDVVRCKSFYPNHQLSDHIPRYEEEPTLSLGHTFPFTSNCPF